MTLSVLLLLLLALLLPLLLPLLLLLLLPVHYYPAGVESFEKYVDDNKGRTVVLYVYNPPTDTVRRVCIGVMEDWKYDGSFGEGLLWDLIGKWLHCSSHRNARNP